MIIGITGTLGAGKGTIVEHLLKKNFKHFSVREFLVDEILKRELESNRENMVLVANDLRAKFGPSYIVEELYTKAKNTKGDCVIESLRCPGEVEALKEKEDFVLFAVDADVETRYSRIFERASETDRISFDEFVVQEQKEMISSDPNKQNLSKCIEMADHCFKNDWTVAELHKKVEKVLETKSFGTIEDSGQKKSEHVRPSWDEYFMKMASLVAERSACIRHNIGAVVVKGKRVLTTGYNSAAKGMPHCTDVGCLRDELGISSGERHEICRAIHAEQNAIIQAGVHGVNIDGGVMYCTHTPCMICAKMIVNAGIKEVISYHNYADSAARNFLREAGIILRKINRPSGEIKFKD
ncbi:AAA family ATPase [Candidatus Pacearchaeota archaeon]|nr:AAA family ATPase [Candidatus Pacearchaeota archaeon]